MEKYIGKSVYKGTAIGPINVLKKSDGIVKRQHVEDVAAELQRLEDAKKQAQAQLGALYEKALQEVGEVNAQIFDNLSNHHASHPVCWQLHTLFYAVPAMWSFSIRQDLFRLFPKFSSPVRHQLVTFHIHKLHHPDNGPYIYDASHKPPFQLLSSKE